MSNTSESNRFDDWTYADCNTCGHYYTDACDGVKVGTTRKCTSYVATRGKDLPRMIGKVQAQLRWCYFGLGVLALAMILLYMVR